MPKRVPSDFYLAKQGVLVYAAGCNDDSGPGACRREPTDDVPGLMLSMFPPCLKMAPVNDATTPLLSLPTTVSSTVLPFAFFNWGTGNRYDHEV